MKLITLIIILILLTNKSYADKNMMIGEKGKESDVDRIIKVNMYDNYFEPNFFTVKKGETIKFEIENLGDLIHEFNIANKKMHIQHQSEMMRMVENEILFSDFIDKEKMKKMAKIDKALAHSHSNSILLEPKEKMYLIWKFQNAKDIEIACNVPGHYDSGMIAKVSLK